MGILVGHNMPQPGLKSGEMMSDYVTMSPEFSKIPLRDIHRFGLDGMLQAYSRNCKHLQNRSPSSLHGKQHKLTKSQGVVLYFYNASLGQHKEVNNMCRSPLQSYKS